MQNDAKTDDVQASKPNVGIPRSNTVVIAGDPGSGKTSLLLTFFKYSNYQLDRLTFPPPSSSESDYKEIQRQEARNDFASLMPPRKSNEPDDTSPATCVRVFVSLESSFERMMETHRTLFEDREKNESEDLFIFIDATSFLVGRLDEGSSASRAKDRHEKAKMDNWKQYAFVTPKTVAGKSRPQGLYWKPEDENPNDSYSPVAIPLAEIPHERRYRPPRPTPFAESSEHAGKKRLFRLITAPQPDTLTRVKLLQSLLSNLLFKFDLKKYNFLLLIDSLSALVADFKSSPEDESPQAIGSYRLSINTLVRWLEDNGVTTLMSTEAKRTNNSNTIRNQQLLLGGVEQYIASGVIQLQYYQYTTGDLARTLQIMKMRGTSHDMRPHAYDLDEHGLVGLEPLQANFAAGIR